MCLLIITTLLLLSHRCISDHECLSQQSECVVSIMALVSVGLQGSLSCLVGSVAGLGQWTLNLLDFLPNIYKSDCLFSLLHCLLFIETFILGFEFPYIQPFLSLSLGGMSPLCQASGRHNSVTFLHSDLTGVMFMIFLFLRDTLILFTGSCIFRVRREATRGCENKGDVIRCVFPQRGSGSVLSNDWSLRDSSREKKELSGFDSDSREMLACHQWRWWEVVRV